MRPPGAGRAARGFTVSMRAALAGPGFAASTRCALALALCILVAPEASAAPPDPAPSASPSPPSPSPSRQKIVLIADRRTDRIMARVYAELATLGFTVVVVRGGADAPGPGEARAGDGGAAVIRVTEVAGGVDVSITQGAGKPLQRTVPVDDDATIAIRVVELLRASLLEVRSPHPPRSEVEAEPKDRAHASGERPRPTDAEQPAPAAPVPAAPALVERVPAAPASSVARPGDSHPAVVSTSTGVAPRREIVGFGAAPAFLWSPGGLPAAPMLDVSAYAMIGSRVGLSTFALIPLAVTSREGKEGIRHVRVALAALGVRVPLGPIDSAWQPSIAAGVSGAWLHVEGEGRAPRYTGTTKDAFAVAPYLRAGISFAPIPRLRIAEHLVAGIAVPRIVIDAAGRATDNWGRPFLGASLGVEVALP